MTELYHDIKKCRACESDRLEMVLDLGALCISDFAGGGKPDRAPLALVQCCDCTLVQLAHTVDRDRLYRRYWYRSSTNESMVAALRDVVNDATTHVTLGYPDAVLDIGANDATLLKMYPTAIKRIGFEPATTFAHDRDWMSDGDAWVSTYFPGSSWIESVPCKIITSVACFYDVDDPNAFVAAIKEWLHPNGIWVCQMMGLEQMLEKNAFDNICHEHLCYWSEWNFSALLSRHGLYVADVSYNAINGGSVRYIVKHGGSSSHNQGVRDLHLSDFAGKVHRLREDTLRTLDQLKADGVSLLGYGASTKGNTLLQYYGIGPDLIPAIADRDPSKWGKFTVGTHIPIISEKDMRDRLPDYLFVLPWAFIDAFKKRERPFLWRGGQFILPLPELKTVGLEVASCQSTAGRHSVKTLAATI